MSTSCDQQLCVPASDPYEEVEALCEVEGPHEVHAGQVHGTVYRAGPDCVRVSNPAERVTALLVWINA